MTDTSQHFAPPWSWLAGVFAAPLDMDALAASRAGIGNLAAHAALPGVAQMRQALEDLPDGPQGEAALAHTYTRLFAGLGGADAVPPYESVFAMPNGCMYGPPESRMRALLAALDLRVADGVAEPADHIAIELAAMAALSGSGALAERRVQLARDLNGWLPAFAGACAAKDRIGFYAGAATLAAALAEQELDFDNAVQETMKSGEDR